MNPPAPPDAPCRVLVGDDEELVRSMLVRYLVDEAGDGRRALDLFRERNFDLVLSDVRILDLDGIQLFKALKEINPRMPVVLVSGYGEVETVVAALKYGAKKTSWASSSSWSPWARWWSSRWPFPSLQAIGQPLLSQVRQITYLEAPTVDRS